MKSTVTIVAAWAAVVILTACVKKEKVPVAAVYPVKIETIEGVRTVVNPAFPREGVVRYALQDDLTIGGEGEGAESVLNRPQDLKVDAQGNMYVLDWGDVEFKVFAPDGRLLRTFGKKGQGPGEFDIPVFSPEGIYLKQVRVPETLYLVRGDAAYSIIRQEDEFLVVKRFKMRREGEAEGK